MTANKTPTDVLARLRSFTHTALNSGGAYHIDDDYLRDVQALIDSMQVGEECQFCEGLGRINCAPDEDGHTHPCDDCQPDALKEFNRGRDAGEFYLKEQPGPEIVTWTQFSAVAAEWSERNYHEFKTLAAYYEHRFPNGLKIVRGKK